MKGLRGNVIKIKIFPGLRKSGRQEEAKWPVRGPPGPVRAAGKFRDLQDWPFGGFREHLISKSLTENTFGQQLAGSWVNLPKKLLWRIQGSTAFTHCGGLGFHMPGLRAVAPFSAPSRSRC